MPPKRDWFNRLSKRIERAAGSKWAFLFAVLSILVWASFGPSMGWSDTHQLIINTFTTLVTYMLCFIIQGTQTRDTAALHAKIDELIKATDGARNQLIGAEQMSPETVQEIRQKGE